MEGEVHREFGRDHSRLQSGTSPGGRGSGSNDDAERLRMFSKLFALYPAAQGEDVELKMSAYMEETRQIPALVLSHALKRLIGARANPYVPSCYEILRACAVVVREWKRKAEGRSVIEHNPRVDEAPDQEIDVWYWIRQAPAVLERKALPPGKIERPAVGEERVIPSEEATRRLGEIADRMVGRLRSRALRKRS